MRDVEAGIVGGLVAGGLLTVAVSAARQSGLMGKTLDEYSEDWLDRNLATRRIVGARGTTALELGSHMAASAAFGAGFAAAKGHRAADPVVGGLLYGAALYVTNIAGLAPMIGITPDRREPAHVVGQRLGLHMLYGVAMSVTTAALARLGRRNRPARPRR
jgi:hypothetical protein